MVPSPTVVPRPGTFGAALAAAADLAGRMAVLGWGSLLAGSMQMVHAELAELLLTLPAGARDAAVGRDAGTATAVAGLPGDRPIHDSLPALSAALAAALDDVTAGRVPLQSPEPVAAGLWSALTYVGHQEQMWLQV
ncbi:MAG: hypothetical protein ACR2JO_14455 [Mycobacteriales bacterium]